MQCPSLDSSNGGAVVIQNAMTRSTSQENGWRGVVALPRAFSFSCRVCSAQPEIFFLGGHSGKGIMRNPTAGPIILEFSRRSEIGGVR